jgi:hypothetical protein
MTFATAFIDPWQGGACWFHARLHGSRVAWRWSFEVQAAMHNRWRCKLLTQCSTGFIHEQDTGVQCTTKRGCVANQVVTSWP